MIRNIIFDVGKVLVAFECDGVLEQLGIKGAAKAAVKEATVNSDLWDEFDRSEKNLEELIRQMVDNAPEYEKEIRLFFQNIGMTIHRFDYANDWIRNLKGRGYHVYILSNYSTLMYEQTKEELSFPKEADGAVFSYQVHYIKPEPMIYEALLKKYGLKPQECIFLDDRKENIRGAADCGIKGILFASYEQAVLDLKKSGVI